MGFSAGDTILFLGLPAGLHDGPTEIVGRIEDGVFLRNRAKGVVWVEDEGGNFPSVKNLSSVRSCSRDELHIEAVDCS